MYINYFPDAGILSGISPWYILSVDIGEYEINVYNLFIYHIFKLISNTDNIHFIWRQIHEIKSVIVTVVMIVNQ